MGTQEFICKITFECLANQILIHYWEDLEEVTELFFLNRNWKERTGYGLSVDSSSVMVPDTCSLDGLFVSLIEAILRIIQAPLSILFWFI